MDFKEKNGMGITLNYVPHDLIVETREFVEKVTADFRGDFNLYTVYEKVIQDHPSLFYGLIHADFNADDSEPLEELCKVVDSESAILQKALLNSLMKDKIDYFFIMAYRPNGTKKGALIKVIETL